MRMNWFSLQHPAGQRFEAFLVAEFARIQRFAAEPLNSCEFSYNQKLPFAWEKCFTALPAGDSRGHC